MLMDLESNLDIDNACCVAEAFKKLSTVQYDVVISDYEMPQKNGLEFLKELREQRNEVAFIIFTGRGREDIAVNALNLGADRYLNKNGSPEAVYSELAHAIKSLAERKKSKHLLRMSESKYRLLVEKSLQGIMIARNAPLSIAFANAAMGKMLGYKPEELTSLSPAEVAALVHHEDRTVFFKRFKSRLEGKEADNNYEFRAVRKDGSITWMAAFSSEIEYNGESALQAMFMDIDERKKIEEVIKKSEVRYRELANFLPEIVFETDLSGKITFFSQTAFEITGFTPEDLEKGMNMLQFVVPEDRERAKENIKRRLAGEKTGNSEYTLFRKNGDTYPAIVKTTPIISEDRLAGLRGLVIDITDRKKTEVSLKESEEKFRNLSEESPNMIFIHVHGRVIYANKKCEEILHYKKEEFYSPDFSFLSLIAPEYVELLKLSYASHMKGEEVPPYEYVLVTRDGKKINAIIASKLIDYEGEKAILGIVTDITESKKIEEKLKINAKKYDTLINATNTGYVIMDGKGLVLDANLEYVRLTGHKTLDQIKGRSVTEWTAKHDLKRNAEEVKKCYQEGFVRNLEIDYVDENGKITPIEINATVIESEQDSVIVTLCRDITERKKAEQAVSASLKRYQSFIEVTGELGWTTNADWRGVGRHTFL